MHTQCGTQLLDAPPQDSQWHSHSFSQSCDGIEEGGHPEQPQQSQRHPSLHIPPSLPLQRESPGLCLPLTAGVPWKAGTAEVAVESPGASGHVHSRPAAAPSAAATTAVASAATTTATTTTATAATTTTQFCHLVKVLQVSSTVQSTVSCLLISASPRHLPAAWCNGRHLVLQQHDGVLCCTVSILRALCTDDAATGFSGQSSGWTVPCSWDTWASTS